MNAEIIAKLEEQIAKEILKQPGRKLDPQEALISSGVIDSLVWWIFPCL